MKRIAIILALTLGCQLAPADDWPEWRGRGRLGVWNETGILDEFPKDGLALEWRTPIHAGFAGPAVTGGRVFVTAPRYSSSKDGVWIHCTGAELPKKGNKGATTLGDIGSTISWCGTKAKQIELNLFP